MSKIKSLVIGSLIGLSLVVSVVYVLALQSELEFYRAHEASWNASCSELRSKVIELQARNDAMRDDLAAVDSALLKLVDRRKAARASGVYHPLRDFLSDDGEIKWTSIGATR